MATARSNISALGERFLTSADGRSQLPLQPNARHHQQQVPVGRNNSSISNNASQLTTSQVFGEPTAVPTQARVFTLVNRRDFVPFNNVEPRTRAYRLAQMDKESLEKQRLVERKGGYHKYEKIKAVTEYEAGTVGFMPESGRFDTDTVGEEWRRRQAKIERAQQIYNNKRQENIVREEHRWAKMEEQKKAEVEKYTRYRADPLMGKKNVGSMPFDVVTLKYNDGADGARMAYEDEQIRYRAALRAKNLHEKSTGSSFDPITGGNARVVPTPQRPTLEANYAHADHSHW